MRKTIWFLAGILIAGNAYGADFNIDKALTYETMRVFVPRARVDIVSALVEKRKTLFESGITTERRFLHFMAQIATETGGLARLDENMNYSAPRLLKIFGKRVTPAQAAILAGDRVATANWVYGARLGNRGRNTNDGWNYRGSGFIQLTGRFNFQKRLLRRN